MPLAPANLTGEIIEASNFEDLEVIRILKVEKILFRENGFESPQRMAHSVGKARWMMNFGLDIVDSEHFENHWFSYSRTKRLLFANATAAFALSRAGVLSLAFLIHASLRFCFT